MTKISRVDIGTFTFVPLAAILILRQDTAKYLRH
jgi:hypothetical protein